MISFKIDYGRTIAEKEEDELRREMFLYLLQKRL